MTKWDRSDLKGGVLLNKQRSRFPCCQLRLKNQPVHISAARFPIRTHRITPSVTRRSRFSYHSFLSPVPQQQNPPRCHHRAQGVGQGPATRLSLHCHSPNTKQHHNCLQQQPSHQISCPLFGMSYFNFVTREGGAGGRY